MFNKENPIAQMPLDTLPNQLAQALPHNAPSIRNQSAP